MGIEGGPIGSVGSVSAAPTVGAAVSVGPALGRGLSIGGIVSGIEGEFGARGGPSLGGIRRGITDLETTVPLREIGSSIVNEGPVAPSFLKNTMPLKLGSLNPLTEQGAVLEAKHWLGIAEPKVNGEVSTAKIVEIPAGSIHKWTTVGYNESRPRPVVTTIEASKIAPHNVVLEKAVLTQLSRRVVQLAEQALSAPAPSAQEQIVEEEAVLLKDKVVEQPKAAEVEEIEKLRFRYLLDEEVAEQRVDEIGKAIDLAKAEADKEGVRGIEGWRIVKFLRLHSGLLSQIVKRKGKDGSLDETVEDLVARKFASRKEANEQSEEIVAQKEPVRRGKEGKTVTEGAVERVFKHHFVKRSPTEEVTRRVKRKQERQIGEKIESLRVKETRIEDDPDLAEVFKTAA